MGNENNSEAFIAQLPQDAEEYVDFARIEARHRFVEDEDPGRLLDAAGDGDELLDGDRKMIERFGHVDVQAEPLDDAVRRIIHAFPVGQAKAARLPAQHQVLRDREVGKQVDLLIYRADPGGLRLADRSRR